ncbi:MAG: methionine synthase [Pelosinus sp.]|nr:methionine synthase [Pelosinus sp.]
MEVVITPAYNPILSNLDISEIKRYAGLHQNFGFSNTMLQKTCSQARILAVPKAIWQVYPYTTKTAAINAIPALTLQGASVRKHLSASVYTAVLAVTIGSILEDETTNYFTKGEYTKGLLLDAAGTTAVEAAADQAAKLIEHEAAKLGCQITKRFSPGYNDFKVTVQPDILALANAKEINVSATASAMLFPRKSITALIGFVPSGTIEVCQTNTCHSCNKINCLARKEI